MKIPHFLAGGLLTAALICASSLEAQTWTTLTNAPPAPLGTAMLLTDGTVMAQGMTSVGYGTGNWYRLTPNASGSYANGTWSTLASMPSGYAPLYYASAVLADGKVVVVGGEYNGSSQSESNKGAIYNPAANTWTSISPPSGWTYIGDAPGIVLANGTFTIGNCGATIADAACPGDVMYQAQLQESTLTWTTTDPADGKADPDSEEGWGLLPNGKVLTVDVWDAPNSEAFNPSTNAWSTAGSTIVTLPSSNPCYEIGPEVLRPEGSVFAVGGTGATAVYSTSSGTWAQGPTLPDDYAVEDGPGAILPDGNVLIDVSAWSTSDCYQTGAHFYEFNGTSLTSVPGPSRAADDATYQGRMLVLPTGQILYTDGSTTVQVYTPAGTYQSAWQPVVTSVASTLTPGSTGNAISGTQFNGLSQGAMYGDDAQMATNYPLVRIVNNTGGEVTYCKTHNHSTMAVATGTATVSTEFDVPAGIPTGAATLYVVANGIPSPGVAVTIAGPNCTATPQCSGDGSFTVATVSLSCTEPAEISTSATVCGLETGGCGTSDGPSGLLTSSSAGYQGETVGSPYCQLDWCVAGSCTNQQMNPNQ